MAKVDKQKFLERLKEAGFAEPQTEYRFDDKRRWRFDYCWPNEGIAIEVQGGLFIKGKHVTGIGIMKDHEKLNAAQVQGWIVLQFSPEQIARGDWLHFLTLAFSYRDKDAAWWNDDDVVQLANHPMPSDGLDPFRAEAHIEKKD